MEFVTGPAVAQHNRRAIGTFASGVAVVTTRDLEGIPLGMTATSFTGVSFDPPTMLICIKRSARTLDHLIADSHFGVNILPASATEIAAYCATPGADKSVPDEWIDPNAPTAAPALRQSLTVIDCVVTETVDSGTHCIVLGTVVGIGLADHRRAAYPLLHYRGAFWHLNSPVVPTAVAPLPLVYDDQLTREAH